MTSPSLLYAILRAVRRLSEPQQQALVTLLEAMQPKQSVGYQPSSKLLQYAGQFDATSVQQMEQAIEEGDKIDYDEW